MIQQLGNGLRNMLCQIERLKMGEFESLFNKFIKGYELFCVILLNHINFIKLCSPGAFCGGIYMIKRRLKPKMSDFSFQPPTQTLLILQYILNTSACLVRVPIFSSRTWYTFLMKFTIVMIQIIVDQGFILKFCKQIFICFKAITQQNESVQMLIKSASLKDQIVKKNQT